jgi:hypothetical protein
MRLRWRPLVPLAVLAAATMLVGFPLTALASVGVGVQAGPVQLAGVAQSGGSYALPPVYVVNTGTQPESVSVRVERLSRGSGRAVPPSWIHADDSGIRLTPHRGARIPLELVVPDGSRPGNYLSDVVVAGSAEISVGHANLGVAAATKLEFRVGKGSAQGPGLALPGWTLWVLGVLLALAIAILAFRRSGLQIRIERGDVDRSTVDR